MNDCIFCKIVNGNFNTEFIYNDGDYLAFNDINPQAPIHILVVPKSHIVSISNSQISEEDVIGKLLVVAKKICIELNILNYRIVINNGSEAGQEVMHLHLHILAGRNLSWPPG